MKVLVINLVILFFLSTIYGYQDTKKYPKYFSWDNYEGRSLITSMQSQKSPHSCGSCWAMSTAQALSDRIKINKYLNRKKDQNNIREYSISDSETTLSSQVLLSCDDYDAYGCYGGQIRQVYRWIKENNITDETCAPYLAKGEKNNKVCNNQTFCSTCNITNSDCNQAVQNYKYFNIDDYGFISGEESMMDQIYHNGPIVCYMRTDPYYDFQYHSGIYIDTSGSNQTDHAVSIIGWGEQFNATLNTTLKYWLIRNTYGSFWGDGGFMKILKGSNNAGIEQECVWATPNLLQYEDKKIKNTKVFIDWRNYNNTNFVSPLRNLLAPQNCINISWSEAALSSIEDRINIFNWKHQLEQKIPVRLALQSVINCINNGKCNFNPALSPKDVYEMAIRQGIPDESCNTFEGQVDLESNQDRCSGLAQCKYCYLPHYPFTHMDDNCTSLPSDFSYTKYFINSYTIINSEDSIKMKREIEKNGPIACQIEIDDQFINYKSGIYSFTKQNQIKLQNHWVTIIGWGQEITSSKEFWICKNSMGSQWGEYGFFRMEINNTKGMNCIFPNLIIQKSEY